MRKKIIIMVFLLAGNIGRSNAADACHFQEGNVSCGGGVVEHVFGNGVVNMRGTHVQEGTNVNGYLSAKDVVFKRLKVNGSTNLSECVISGDAEIRGALQASVTHFKLNLNIRGKRIKLIKSVVSGDVHFYPSVTKKKQVLFLEDKTKIIGNVIFDDGEGEVITLGRSKVLGKIMGGHLIKK